MTLRFAKLTTIISLVVHNNPLTRPVHTHGVLVQCMQGATFQRMRTACTTPKAHPMRMLGSNISPPPQRRNPKHTLAAAISPVDTTGVASGAENGADEGTIDWRRRW
jgi:hypothetical protein